MIIIPLGWATKGSACGVLSSNSEHNKINRLKVTSFDRLRTNGINQSFLKYEYTRIV